MIKICTAGIFILLLASESIAGGIDCQMLQIFSAMQNRDDDQIQAVVRLVRRAEELDSTPNSQFGWQQHKGASNLLKLISQYESCFFPTSLRIIKDYLRTGKLPESAATTAVNAMKLFHGDGITKPVKPIANIEICAVGLVTDNSSNSPNEMFANVAGLIRKIKQIEEQKKPDRSDYLKFKNQVVQSQLDVLKITIDIMAAEGTLTPEVENALRATVKKIKEGSRID